MSSLAFSLVNINSWCQTLKPFADVKGCKLFGVAAGAIVPFHFKVLKCCLSAEDDHSGRCLLMSVLGPNGPCSGSFHTLRLRCL